MMLCAMGRRVTEKDLGAPAFTTPMWYRLHQDCGQGAYVPIKGIPR